MFIQTETTPNPETLKFSPERIVLAEGTASYSYGDDCRDSPLATRLLELDGVIGVFFSQDFITITKDNTYDWRILKPVILSILLEHFVSDAPIVVNTSTAAPLSDEPIVREICAILDSRIRPAVAQDGGDIAFHAFENGVLYLTMHGACAGCPSSQATLKAGVENLLRYYVPEVLEVRAINA